MTLIDCHIHTSFSFDSETEPKKILDLAAQTGAAFVAITDHIDLNPLEPNKKEVFDPKSQYEHINNLRQDYKNLNVAIGVELGFTPQNCTLNKALVESNNFECIINSVHEIDGSDCYFPQFFEGKDKYFAYRQYFERVRESLDAPYYYNTVGHLGYVTRNAPYPDREFDYNDYKDILDDILKTIIQKQKILEINSSAYNLKDKCLPSLQVLRRYYDLGGRLINFGSDAHRPQRLFDGYDYVVNIAKEIGFTYFSAVKYRKLLKFVL